MSSSNNQRSKPSKVAKISVRPIWNQKLDASNKPNTSNDVASKQPIQTPPSSPSSNHSQFIEELEEAHELNALLAMHLAQNNLDKPPSSPYSNCLPHSLNKNQVENHVHYCPCCIRLQQEVITLHDKLSWLEFLITSPKYSLAQNTYHQSTPSAPNSSPPSI